MKFRYADRYPSNCAVKFLGPDVMGDGIATELSEAGAKVAGVKVVGAKEVIPGMRLALRIWLRTYAPPVTISETIVKWVKGSEFGVEFLTVGQTDASRLQRVVNKLKPKQKKTAP